MDLCGIVPNALSSGFMVVFIVRRYPEALAAAARNGATVERKGLLWIVTAGARRLSLFPDGHLLVHDCTVTDDALAAVADCFQAG